MLAITLLQFNGVGIVEPDPHTVEKTFLSIRHYLHVNYPHVIHVLFQCKMQKQLNWVETKSSAVDDKNESEILIIVNHEKRHWLHYKSFKNVTTIVLF